MAEYVAPLIDLPVTGSEFVLSPLLDIGNRIIGEHALLNHEVGKYRSREDVLCHRAVLGIGHPATSPAARLESIA